MELNPNNPVTRAVSDHWHKIAAILMVKDGKDHVIITSEDICRMEGKSIVIQELNEKIHLRIVSEEEGLNLAKMQGGLPC